MNDCELMFSFLHFPVAGITTGVHHHTQLDCAKRHSKTFTYMTSSNLYKDPQCERYYHPIFQMGKVKPRLFKPVSKDPTVPTRLWPLKVGHTEGTGLHCRTARPTFQRSTLTSQAPLQNDIQDNKYSIRRETKVKVSTWKCAHPYLVSIDVSRP